MGFNANPPPSFHRQGIDHRLSHRSSNLSRGNLVDEAALAKALRETT
jgi:hypothetical protein